MAGGKDKAKLSFYKARRKDGMSNEQARELWIAKKLREVEEKDKVEAAGKASG